MHITGCHHRLMELFTEPDNLFFDLNQIIIGRNRRIFISYKEEMLKEFAYLGSEKAEEVVITNTNRIADMCEKISPVRPDKCPPVIENSDQMLRDICYNKAHKMYGDPRDPTR